MAPSFPDDIRQAREDGGREALIDAIREIADAALGSSSSVEARQRFALVCILNITSEAAADVAIAS